MKPPMFCGPAGHASSAHVTPLPPPIPPPAPPPLTPLPSSLERLTPVAGVGPGRGARRFWRLHGLHHGPGQHPLRVPPHRDHYTGRPREARAARSPLQRSDNSEREAGRAPTDKNPRCTSVWVKDLSCQPHADSRPGQLPVIFHGTPPIFGPLRLARASSQRAQLWERPPQPQLPDTACCPRRRPGRSTPPAAAGTG
jgi:hypothetical protein